MERVIVVHRHTNPPRNGTRKTPNLVCVLMMGLIDINIENMVRYRVVIFRFVGSTYLGTGQMLNPGFLIGY